MKDISDYLWRMFMAAFLCPVAATFWLAFGSFGFDPGRFMLFIGSQGQHYVALDSDGQMAFLFQALFGWAALAFVFMLISFVVNPPRFRYTLNKKSGKADVSVVQ
ncbi:hypothetical protein [Sulfuricella denitrificans]|nr:hypothetical protein [Sulfuricella denitrificans]